LYIPLLEYVLDSVNLSSDVAGRDPGHLRYLSRRLTFEVKQDDLAIQRFELVNQIQKDGYREPAIDLGLGINQGNSSFESLQIHQPRGQAAAPHHVGSSHVVSDPVHPRLQTATAVKRLEAYPKLQVHFLKEISLLIRIGLIAPG
jgi:hypothetical protein